MDRNRGYKELYYGKLITVDRAIKAMSTRFGEITDNGSAFTGTGVYLIGKEKQNKRVEGTLRIGRIFAPQMDPYSLFRLEIGLEMDGTDVEFKPKIPNFLQEYVHQILFNSKVKGFPLRSKEYKTEVGAKLSCEEYYETLEDRQNLKELGIYEECIFDLERRIGDDRLRELTDTIYNTIYDGSRELRSVFK